MDARTNHIKSSDLKDDFKNVTSSNSIGISLVGAGDDDFTPEQIAAARDLASQLQGNLDISNVYGQGAIQAGKMASEGVSLANMVNEAASSEPFDYSILDPDPEEDMDLFPVDSGEPTIPDFSIRDPEEDVGLFPADSGEGELPDIDTDTVIQNVLAGESGADIPDIDTDSVIEELLGSGVTLTPEDEELADLIVQDVLEGYTDPPGPDDVPELSGFEKFMQSTLGELLGNSVIPFGGTLISWASSQRQSDLDKMATLLNSGNGRAVYDANGEIMGVYDLTTGS